MPRRASDDEEWILDGKWTSRRRVPTIAESEKASPAHGETSSAGLHRQSGTSDQADFGATQVGPGSLLFPPVDPETLKSVPNTLFDLPFDATEGEQVIEETSLSHRL